MLKESKKSLVYQLKRGQEMSEKLSGKILLKFAFSVECSLNERKKQQCFSCLSERAMIPAWDSIVVCRIAKV